MTNCAVIDLAHGSLAARQTPGVVFGSQVAHQRGHAKLRPHPGECRFQERRLSRSGTGDQVDDKYTGAGETAAQFMRELIVVPQDILADFHNSWRGIHEVNSRAVTCNSRP